jgi:CheY-like chemotaxis protein
MARILAIDDHPSVRKVLEFCLQRDGHSVLLAADGPTGLRMAADNSVDFVILDYDMPVMNGVAVCKAMKADPVLRQLPLVMITAYSTNEIIRQALGAGALEVIPKPFSMEHLKTTVNRYLTEAKPVG